MRSTWTWITLGAASVALCAPRPAEACSPLPCWPGAFVPDQGGRVPANVPGLYWRPMSDPYASVMPENVVLENMAAPGTSIGLTAQKLANGDYLLVPAVPLVAGSHYRLTDRSMCMLNGERGPEVVFEVGPEAPLPSRIGALSATAATVLDMELATASGSCFSKATVVQTSIELVQDSAAAPWVDALHFETMVDGEPWHYARSIRAVPPPGESPDGRARDRVFVVCASNDPTVGEGLAEGTHVVTMRATLPGTTQVMLSSELEVKLSCAGKQPDPKPEPEPDAGPGMAGCSAGGPGVAGGIWFALVVRRRKARSA